MTLENRNPVTSDEEIARQREIELRVLEIMTEYEGPKDEAGARFRNKDFWYGVFGFIFALAMGALIWWVYKDLRG